MRSSNSAFFKHFKTTTHWIDNCDLLQHQEIYQLYTFQTFQDHLVIELVKEISDTPSFWSKKPFHDGLHSSNWLLRVQTLTKHIEEMGDMVNKQRILNWKEKLFIYIDTKDSNT